MQRKRSKDSKHSCPAHDFHAHVSGKKAHKIEVKMKISPVLGGAAAFLGNHVFANPKLIPERERGEIKGDYVGEWCVLSLSSACVCVCPGSARVFVVGNVATLFIPEPRGGAAPKLHDSCDWLRGKPDVCPLSCGLGGFIWLCGCIQGMVSHDFCFVILTFF